MPQFESSYQIVHMKKLCPQGRGLPSPDTAGKAKTALYSLELNQLFVALPHLLVRQAGVAQLVRRRGCMAAHLLFPLHNSSFLHGDTC